MRIILVAGMPGAGKEELLTVARGMGLPFLRMGDLVREEHVKASCPGRGIPVGQFANSEREEHGRDIWAKRAVARMDGDIFLVDGCRSMDEVDAYRAQGEEIVILGIFASPGQRFERLVRRARDDAPADLDEFAARDRREMGWGLAEVLALADVMICNDSDLESFKTAAARTLEGLV